MVERLIEVDLDPYGVLYITTFDASEPHMVRRAGLSHALPVHTSPNMQPTNSTNTGSSKSN